MKKEYDFSKGVRGKFYRPDAEFYFPVYLRPEIARFIEQKAEEKGRDTETLVNDWLEEDIRIVESVVS